MGRLAALIGTASILSSAVPARVPPRSPQKSGWSGPGINLAPHDGYVDIRLDCVLIRAPLPNGLPRSGRFTLQGQSDQARPGPQMVDESGAHSAGEPTRVDGKIVGSRLLLSIVSAGGIKTDYTLTRGGGPGPVRCL